MVFAFQSPETSIVVVGGEKAISKGSIWMQPNNQDETKNNRTATRVKPNSSPILRGRRSTLILLYEAIQAANQPTAITAPIESKIKRAICGSPGNSFFMALFLTYGRLSKTVLRRWAAPTLDKNAITRTNNKLPSLILSSLMRNTE